MADTVRKYPINVIQEVMPFIHFHLKWSTEQVLEFAATTALIKVWDSAMKFIDFVKEKVNGFEHTLTKSI